MSAVEARNGRVDVEIPADEDAKQCARLLKAPHANLKSIDLRRGLVTSAGAGAIAKALKGNSSLRHLGLPGNNIGDVGVAAIGRAVEGNLGCALTSVDFSATGITVVGLSNLVQGVSRLPNLHTVCLNDNNLAQEAGLQLSNLLKASASLHTVLAGENYLGDRGLAALCGAFCYLKPARVLSLDVSGNGIGDLGVQWLCKGISALCRNQNNKDTGGGGGSGIRDLRLRGNNITHAGAKELAKLLAEDRCARDLRELDLSMNTITADGFRPLAVSLRGCRELVRLDVAGCRLGPGGVDAAADLIAASGPKLRAVILTPKAEFADRVLGDRGGLAVALRQSLQRLADSLPFAGAVLEVSLGAFLRADPGAAASIEETLRERRERAGVGGGDGDGGKIDTTSPAAGRRGGGGGGGGSSSSSRSGEKPRVNGSSRLGGGRVRADSPGTPSGMTSSGSRRAGGTTPRAGGIPTTPASSSRAAARAREAGSSRHGARGTGIERPKAGIERQKPGTAERVRRGAAPRSSPGSAGASSTPPAGPSLHRTSSKASMRGASGSGRSSSERSRQQLQQHKTTAAKLTACDRAAAAQPAPHKRMHQGEELDSIDGFTPTEARHAPPPSSSSSSSPSAVPPTSSSSRRLLASKASSATMVRTHSRSGSTSSFGDGDGGGKHGAGVGAADSIADVVSKVMGDTAAMADDQESPPSVAPSTWEWTGDGTGEAAAASGSRRGLDEPASPGGRGEGRKTLLRKSSAASVRAVPDSSGEPELSSGLASLAVTVSDERRPRSDSRSRETAALEVRSAGGGDSQQLVTVGDASRMLAPLVAQEVKKVEIRMQNEMNAALRTMRSEMEAIDREGLMARVAMEKRLKTGIKRLLDRIDHLERRFAKLDREDRKRLTLEATSNAESAAAPPALTDGATGTAAAAHGDLLLSPSSVGRAVGGSAAEKLAAMSKGRRTGGGGGGGGGGGDSCFASDADSPESRPLVVREAWGGGGGGDGKAALSAMSSTVASDEDFSESGDETEADIVRMLEEKMAALEGKLLGHEERQRSDPRAGEGLGVGMPSAVYA